MTESACRIKDLTLAQNNSNLTKITEMSKKKRVSSSQCKELFSLSSMGLLPKYKMRATNLSRYLHKRMLRHCTSTLIKRILIIIIRMLFAKLAQTV